MYESKSFKLDLLNKKSFIHSIIYDMNNFKIELYDYQQKSLSRMIQLTAQPVFPIIRPRGGDFLYTDEEFEVIKSDLLLIKDLGYAGAVIGMLKEDGSIDVNRTAELVSMAGHMEITFHRAFDRCKDPLKGLEDIIQTGCKRILTSGQVPNAGDALPLIKKLVDQANERIIIMPGSGVRASNIQVITNTTDVKEIHSSARKALATKMYFNQPTMKENLQVMGVDTHEIKSMLKAIK
jgi:copper homeostasis protein